MARHPSFDEARDAIKRAMDEAPAIVDWNQGVGKWEVRKASEAPSNGAKAEILVATKSAWFPISPEGLSIVSGLIDDITGGT